MIGLHSRRGRRPRADLLFHGTRGLSIPLGFLDDSEVDDAVRNIDWLVNDDSPPLDPCTERTHGRAPTTNPVVALQPDDPFTLPVLREQFGGIPSHSRFPVVSGRPIA